MVRKNYSGPWGLLEKAGLCIVAGVAESVERLEQRIEQLRGQVRQAGMLGARLTSLRRDEERSFVAAPFTRPYYICSALTADLLAAARGLLAVSTWPMQQRVVGPLSPRVDFLSAAIAIAEYVGRTPEP